MYVLFEEDQKALQDVVEHQCRDANAKAVLLIDKNGQEIAAAGEIEELDITSLSSLTAGNVAATGGIAKLRAEQEFTGQYHEGMRIYVHITSVAQRLIVVVLFDHRSSLGLVRLRVKRASQEIDGILQRIDARSQEQPEQTVFEEITDEDIDKLFGDD